MKYFDQRAIEKGRRNIKIVVLLFSLLYGILLVNDIFFLGIYLGEGISILNNAKMGLAILVLYLFYRGNEKVYFYVQIQIFVWLVVMIGFILMFVYDISLWVHGWDNLIFVIPGTLISLGIPIAFMMKSKFIGDIETYMEYRKAMKPRG